MLVGLGDVVSPFQADSRDVLEDVTNGIAFFYADTS